MTPDLSALIRRAQDGDDAALAFVMASVDAWLKTLAKRHAPLGMEWDDALQEARLRGVEAVLSFRPGGGALTNWIHVRVTSLFLDMRRQEAFRRRRIPADLISLMDIEWTPAPDPFRCVLAHVLVGAIFAKCPPSPKNRAAIDIFLAGDPLQGPRHNYWPAFSSWLKKARRQFAGQAAGR